MLCAARPDVALVVAGDGPYLAEMKAALKGCPAHFLGFQSDEQLAPLYASADLFVFPSRTDTLGQVVMEAQASGLPVLVSDEGGPKEMIHDGVTGLVVPGRDAQRWCNAMDTLLSDDDLRQRMSRTAPQRMGRFSLEKTFESFWAEHVTVVEPPPQDEADVSHTPWSPVKV
jgi:glycosyltransferase involved in cell wall biosynthesis